MKAIYLADRYLYETVMTVSVQKELRSFLTELNTTDFEELKKSSAEVITKKIQEYDILIGGWGAVALPKDYRPIKPQFYQNITGTFAGKVEPEHVERGLRISNWGDSISHTIAESALTMILACLKNVGFNYDSIHIKKEWRSEERYVRSLFNRRVGLFGFGMIAQQLVRLLTPFDVQVFAYDPYVPEEVFEQYGVKRVQTLEQLFSENEIISVHAAKTEETNHLINKTLLKMMKDDAILVNTGRGNVLDEKALAEEHAIGRLLSALDVFEIEPLPKESPLRGQPRCLIFPHQAGPTKDQYFRMMDRAVDNIRRFTRGEPIFMELSAQKLRIMT